MEEKLELEKPFTDPKARYTVINSEDPNSFELINLTNGNKYITNPFEKICNCKDFQFRTNGGTCKHIEFLRGRKEIKPLLIEYGKNRVHVEGIHTNNGLSVHTPVPEIVEQMPYTLMEQKDENQILAEIKGNVLDEFFYSFPQGNRTITGLSYAGVKQITLMKGHIHCGEPIFQETKDAWICKAKATDTKNNLVMWGAVAQSKFMTLRTGEKIRDDFCMQKAEGKAERNALRKLIPEKVIIEMRKEWQSKKNSGGNGK